MCGQVTMRFLLCSQLIFLVVVQSASGGGGAPAAWNNEVSAECITKNAEAVDKAKTATAPSGGSAAMNTNWETLNPFDPTSQKAHFDNLKEAEFKKIMNDKWGKIWTQASLTGSEKPGPHNAAMSVKSLVLIRETLKEIVEKATLSGEFTKPRYDKPKKWDQLRMHDVNDLIVKPLASGLKVSLAQLMQYMESTEAIKELDGSSWSNQVKNSYVGPITHFVSHDWAGVFNNFVTSVLNHCGSCDQAKTYYWVCTFANNQYGFYPGDGHRFLETSPFGVALRHGVLRSRSTEADMKSIGIKSILSIQCDGDECYDTTDSKANSPSMTMKRIWCVYEMKLVISLKLPLWWSCNKATVFEVTEGTKMDGKCTAALKTWMETEQTPQAAAVSQQGACDKQFILKDIGAEPDDVVSYTAMPPVGAASILVTKFRNSDFRICDKIAAIAKTAPAALKTKAPYKDYTFMSEGEMCLTEWFQRFAKEGAPKREIGAEFASSASAELGRRVDRNVISDSMERRTPRTEEHVSDPMKHDSVASSFLEESNFVILYGCFTLFSLILVVLYYRSDRGEKIDIDLAHLLEENSNAVC